MTKETYTLRRENSDLLEALRTIAEWSVPVDEHDPEDPQTEYGQIKRFARQAISKATGENQPVNVGEMG